MRLAVAAFVLLVGCGGSRARAPRTSAGAVPIETHRAEGRPRLAIVRRAGDPAAALAIEVAVPDSRSSALSAGVLASRLERAGFALVESRVGRTMARIRALWPAPGEQSGRNVARLLDETLTRPLGEADLPAIRAALTLASSWPVDGVGESAAGRCLERPTAASNPTDFPRNNPQAELAFAEKLLRPLLVPEGVVLGLVGVGDAFEEGVRALAEAPPWRRPPSGSSGSAGSSGARLESPSDGGNEPTLSVVPASIETAQLVVEGLPRSVVSEVLGVLSAPRSALASRLRAADGYSVRALEGVSAPAGGCVVVEVQPPRESTPTRDTTTSREDVQSALARTALALEVSRREIELAVEASQTNDGEAARIALATAGDPREAADRAAWWSWPSTAPAPRVFGVVRLPTSMAVHGPADDVAKRYEELQTRAQQAQARARLILARSEVEVRSQVEPGQGELWAVLASPCGLTHETAGDAGLATITTRALVATERTHDLDGVVLEPWVTSSGVGLLAHAPRRPKEDGLAHARRIGHVLGRVFLTAFPGVSEVSVERASLLAALARSEPGAKLVRAALGVAEPQHPSWLDPLGTLESVARISLSAAELRLDTWRVGPLRLAVLAGDTEQADGLSKAVERWVARRPFDARSCPPSRGGPIPAGAIWPRTVSYGTGLAVAAPVAADEREAVAVLASVLRLPDGPLARNLGSGLATSWDVQLVRGVDRHALVVVVTAPDANLDAVGSRVSQMLTHLSSSLTEADLAKALRARAEERLRRTLEPRARMVDLFSGEAVTALPTLTSLRATAANVLSDTRLQLVVARLPGTQ